MATRKSCRACAVREERIAELTARVAALEARLALAQKNSATSSKPPSSDIVKPPKKLAAKRGREKKRKAGGQPGHPRHERPLFPPAEVDRFREHSLDSCPECGSALQASDEPPRILQQVEIVARPIRVEEHRARAWWCAKCQKVHHAPLPKELQKAGLAGPRLTALVAYLKGACHGSFSTVQNVLRDVFGIPISRGQLAKLVQKVSASLEAPYEELRSILPREDLLNVDETGHPEQRKRLWTWCFRAELFTLFHIDPSRGSDVLIEMLGKEFNGVLGCDYFSAYRKFMKDFGVALQFCLAHLIRDVKFLVEHPQAANRRYGKRLLKHLRDLFGTIHRRETFASEASFRRQLHTISNRLLGDAILRLENTREAGNLADRFVDNFENYFRFITTPRLEPTNNLAERAIRFVAIHRRMTQGTRGERGRRWCERIWTALATCNQHGRSVFDFLCDAVKAHLAGRPAPSLLPDTS